MLYEKPPIKYTDMAIYIDSHIYSGDYDEEKVFIYLYHLIWMLSHQSKLFTRAEYYEEFALIMAEDMFMRLINPKQFELKENGEPKLQKIKSILNYIKQILYARKVSFEQDYYSQSLTLVPELEEELVVSRFNVSNQIYRYMKGYDEIETLECLKKVHLIVRDYIYTLPYLTQEMERENIYISCMLTLSSLFDISLKEKKVVEAVTEDNVILYHLDVKMKDYIIVLCRQLLKQIQNVFKINLFPSFDEKEIITTMALEAKDSADIVNIYE